MVRTLLFFTLYFLLKVTIFAQNVNPELLKRSWPAQWITCPDVPLREYGVYQFRKDIVLSEVPNPFIIHISADNRYKFYVNGREISKGPVRSDSRNWNFETIDIAPFLSKGENVLSALVWNQGEYKGVAQHSEMTGLLVQSDILVSNGQVIPNTQVNTDKSWKVKIATAYSPTSTNSMSKLQAYTVVGCGDLFDANKHDWGWMEKNIDESAWRQAKTLERGMPIGSGSGAHWHLIPRTIPAMDEHVQRFKTLRRSSCNVAGSFIKGEKLTIPKNTVCTLLIDNGVLSVGYPVINISGGKNATIETEYAEALFDQKNQKGNRNEIEGKTIKGYTDLLISDGGQNRSITTLWLKTFRYVQLTIETKDEDLIINDFYHITSIYPLQENAKFASSDARLDNIWDIGWRTARLCALESYVDCPYYEQLQYVGDTRIQALITMYVDGDDKLVRKAISDINNSMVAEGLTQSRYPSYVLQIIPPFSLFWIDMVSDHYMHYGDKAFTSQYLPNIERVLSWFDKRVDPKTGILGPLEWWNFVDWAPEWNWTNIYAVGGSPEGVKEGGSSVLTLQYAYALNLAAQMFEDNGDHTKAKMYKQKAKNLTALTLKQCYDPVKQILANTPNKNSFSEHANILGVLTDAFTTKKQQQEVLKMIMSDTKIIKATYYFRFYLFQALKKAGMADLYYSQLKPWHEMVDLGLTTFAEKPEPARSDCHAWSASPNYDFLATICGIAPSKSGFKEVLIQPALGELSSIYGSMPHHLGTIEVNLTKNGEKGITGNVNLPIGLPGIFVWKDQKLVLKGGENKVNLK